MTSAAFQLSPVRALVLSTTLSLLAGCGANTEGAVPATATTELSPNAAQAKPRTGPTAQGNVATAFTPALGSSGKGAVMTELKNHGGQLRDPDAKYDVFDSESTADLKTLKQNILASLDRDRNVLIDSDGTPESRQKAAQISKEAIGASLPDQSAVLIRKAPEEMGGGYALIPIYTRADVAEQMAQGKIVTPQDLNNAAENFFFLPAQTQK